MTPENNRRPNHRRLAALGVTAGLLGGGAIGLVATMPSITSAASTVDEPAALQDDTTDTTDSIDTTDTADRPERSERIREVLQALVDDGTITDVQADAVAAHLDEQAPERGDRRGRQGRASHIGSVVADVIGIDNETLREGLAAGQSVAEIAEANGVDTQVVIDALVEQASVRLDAAVENGRFTEDEVADRLAELTERVTAKVNGEGGFGPRG